MALLGNQSQVIYQARPNVTQTIKDARHQLHKVGRDYKNRHVRIQTIDGMIYEGIISHAEGPFIFLIVSNPQGGHGGYGYSHQPYGGYPQPRGLLYNQYYYNNVILPLVLYELLVITLLYT
ncbi:hypothetical protein SAMN04488542_11431 [Fontibacillus panacisegetis]|uniref:Uncharacterized protein n=1 Tax=Fontibacillus panacisegetis TaxID=670482 RepID=A0A1G7MNN1_9BACL|nr:hypothetical protein [Fontibacillus panacisegetis]SDF63236.1 hypothetical protein SAMN04488542_11431 [Fontibacillus panacisegetis]